MTWTVECRNGYLADWVEQSELSGYRNRVGTPCTDSAIDITNEDLFPGALRYTAASVDGSNIVWNVSVFLASDARHPEDGGTVPLPAAPNPATWYEVGEGRSVKLAASPQIGDQFDQWYGHQYDELSGLFAPVLAFGALYPSTQGETLELQLTNNSGYTAVNAILQWEIEGDGDEFFSVKHEDEAEWTPGSSGFLYLHDDRGIPGVVADDGQVSLEISPFSPETFILGLNPVKLNITLTYSQV